MDEPAAPMHVEAPAPARPSFWTASPYLLVSNPTLPEDRIGLGGELSIMWHRATDYESLFCFDVCWGGLLQVESLPSVAARDERVARVAVAGQGAWGPFGLELGPALETTPSGGAILGAHGGAFFSVGFGSIGLRGAAYPGRFAESDHGLEGALVFRATLPLLLPVVWVPRTGEVGSAGFTHALGRFPM